MHLPAPFSLCLRSVFLPGALAVLLCLSSPARADDAPFDLESSSWMSFDRYKEKPSNWLAPDQRAEAEAHPVVVAPPVMPPSMPVVSDPVRPIETPVMPGLNKDFDIRVDSTEDDHRLPIAKPDKDDDKDKDGLPDSAWKNASDVAHQKTDLPVVKNSGDDEDNSSPLNVRFTALPPWSVPPSKTVVAMTPVPQTPPAVKIAQPVVAPPPTPPAPPAVLPADAAACAALDAYKKRQLAAIQSDRQTLTALQNAIAQLGLQKQLDFMPGISGSLNVQAAGSGPAKN